jgi:2,4-diaminopentanoate dehydrogenase
MEKIKVVQFGCGPVGCSIARLASGKANIELLGAIDLLNNGMDLGEVGNFGSKIGVLISNDAEAVLAEVKPDIVLLATTSVLKDIYPQVETICKAGANIVSTCEELSYPFKKQPELAGKINSLAKKNDVTILSTGVNPGFLMDVWPLFMSGVCQHVKRIRVVRIQDASPRRLPFQKKIGAGRTIAEFKELVRAGTLKHVGLPESIAMIADGLKWELQEIKESIEPIIAKADVRSNYITVKEGQAAGVKQVGVGLINGEAVISLEFEAYIGAKDPRDAVYITGTPDIEVVIKGGTHGDIATSAMVVNAIPRVFDAQPGLITMKDMPVISSLPDK